MSAPLITLSGTPQTETLTVPITGSSPQLQVVTPGTGKATVDIQNASVVAAAKTTLSATDPSLSGTTPVTWETTAGELSAGGQTAGPASPLTVALSASVTLWDGAPGQATVTAAYAPPAGSLVGAASGSKTVQFVSLPPSQPTPAPKPVPVLGASSSSAVAWIGAAGGSMEVSADGATVFKLEIPASAVSSMMQFIAQTGLPAGASPLSNSLSSISIDSTNTPASYLSTPATLIFYLAKVPAHPVSVVYWNRLLNQWEPLAGVSTHRNLVYATTYHLTAFAVVPMTSANTITRLDYPGRANVAIQAADTAFPDGATQAVLVVGTAGHVTPAGAGAIGLAGAIRAPILYVTGSRISAADVIAMQNLGVQSVYLVGGAAATDGGVKDTLAGVGISVRQTFSGGQPEQIVWAIDRYLLQTGLSDAHTVFVANGASLVDVISAGPVIYRQGAPIWLTTSAEAISPEQAKWLADHGVFRAVVLGGNKAVSDQLETNLQYALKAAVGRATLWQVQSHLGHSDWIAYYPKLQDGTTYTFSAQLAGSGQAQINVWTGTENVGSRMLTLSNQYQTESVTVTIPAGAAKTQNGSAPQLQIVTPGSGQASVLVRAAKVVVAGTSTVVGSASNGSAGWAAAYGGSGSRLQTAGCANRLAGADREQTAIAIDRAYYPQANGVVAVPDGTGQGSLAYGLSAAEIGGLNGVPLVLSGPQDLSAGTRRYLLKLAMLNAGWLMGDRWLLAPGVERTLSTLAVPSPVAGGNLVSNSSGASGVQGWIEAYGGKDSTLQPVTISGQPALAWKVNRAVGHGDWVSYYPPVENGRTYVFSVTLSGSGQAQLNVWTGTENIPAPLLNLSTTRKTQTITVTIPNHAPGNGSGSAPQLQVLVPGTAPSTADIQQATVRATR